MGGWEGGKDEHSTPTGTESFLGNVQGNAKHAVEVPVASEFVVGFDDSVEEIKEDYGCVDYFAVLVMLVGAWRWFWISSAVENCIEGWLGVTCYEIGEEPPPGEGKKLLNVHCRVDINEIVLEWIVFYMVLSFLFGTGIRSFRFLVGDVVL